jgi:hypothetical protein
MKKIFILLLILSATSLNAQTSGSLSVTVSTAGTGLGGYAPSYVMAIWVEDNSNKFVKTLLQYGFVRYYNLDKWVMSSQENKFDAITGATLTTQSTKICNWNGKDFMGNDLDDGIYKIKMQLTDDEFSGRSSIYTFTKGSTSQTLTPADVLPSFKNVSLKWTPTNTAINNLPAGNKYSVYPNPTRSRTFVSGYDIEQIELFDLNGKKIITSNNQQFDVSYLPKGIYLVKIKSKSGTYIKKIEKI